MTTKNIEYSKTVFLPKTSFSMKGNLPAKEPTIIEFWNKIKLYKKMLENRKNSEPYLLHDGPPYANGHIHIGHALNKILKDIVIKSQSMMGHYTPYVPGWDCHGLPIEQQLLKELKMGKKHISDIAAFRKKAREFAAKFVDIQKEEFQRLGIIGDWDNSYITMSENYEATVIKSFNELLRKEYIFKGKKTISWCATCETALADAEVEYKDKTSPSIYVKFKLISSQSASENILPMKNNPNAGVYLVIWTTTPWTLPANMAAAVSKEENYRLIETETEILILADKLADSFIAETDIEGKKLGLINGEKLVGLKYEHCLAPSMPKERNFERSVISTDFVDMETGTGIVHIAPGHGEDDFYAGKKWELEVFCPVNNSGCFTKEAGEFEGLKVFKANEKIIKTLENSGHLIASKSVSHSYPHCWRCKQPIIFRATEQWFLGIDHKDLRQTLMNEAEKVSWVPQTGKERMMNMLEQRPDWCLSRQRYWGTPIPVLYCKSCQKIQIDEILMKHIEERVFKEGSDFWFSAGATDIIPKDYKCSCGGADFEKEKDILDVWLDSGVSWRAVIKDAESLGAKMYPADLYLEGSDQHRGWFQTSLIPSVALNGKPPYKTVLTHGFVLDDKGKAMHKSSGNVVSPQEIYQKYGAEILRLWVALSDYCEDIRISDKLLSGPIDIYRKIRNTIRYILGNLSDFNPRENYVSDDNIAEMDRYIRHRLSLAIKDINSHYQKYEYRHAARRIADFCILDLSAFYLDALKDKLYTLSADDNQRRSAQTVLYDVLLALLQVMAPILSFTAEEAWQVIKKEIYPNLSESVFLSDLPKEKSKWLDEKLNERWTKIMKIREKVLKSIEDMRGAGKIGSSLEAKILFTTSDAKTADFLKSTIELWPAIAIISECEIKFDEAASRLDISAVRASGTKCPRCWQWRKDIGLDNEFADICGRCADVMKKTIARQCDSVEERKNA
ncbi:MAG: isoleucine--tRNA ligase [Elusimicrobia bacterium]|nr:isoleucine--tRNA ligase [Elusimicrobiota bacterium]